MGRDDHGHEHVGADSLQTRPAGESPLVGSTANDATRSAWSSLAPLALVAVALIGSVAIPAWQTWHISSLLRQTTEVLGPARVQVAKLESGLAEELGVLQSYALSGDATMIERYHPMVVQDEQRLAALEQLAARLNAPSAKDISALRLQIGRWRQPTSESLIRGPTPTGVAGALRSETAAYNASIAAIANLAADFALEAETRDNLVARREHLSLSANLGLVLAALAALYGVMVLTRRQFALSAILRGRIQEESARARQEMALRGMSEALAGAFTTQEVTERIVNSALDALEGRGAFIELVSRGVDDGGEVVTVAAVAGRGTPPLSSTCGLAGSYAERASIGGAPMLVDDIGTTTYGLLGTLGPPGGQAMVVPLGSQGANIGALFVLSQQPRFHSDAVARAVIIGHLTALAYERARLLDEAITARRRLELVIQSRSRLMRGFSHDVKNPVGAADGYAALLSEGVYGQLNARQQESLARMRRAMHGALDLIDELHELARAETGHLSLDSEPTDLAALVQGMGEEYQATADARGLSLTVCVSPGMPVIQTSKTRVRQIASNLLSNAIKYTDAGSITVDTGRRRRGPFGEPGDWVVIEFIDTGRGVPADKLDFIFEEFGRISDGDHKGAGLGLAISRVLAQALGGHISVESQLGRGSTFTLWLPLGARDACGAAPPMPKSNAELVGAPSVTSSM